MVSDYKKNTDEELIAIVNQYMEDHPNAGRNHIILHAHGNHQRIRELDKQGLISLPKAQPKGGTWRKYFYIQSVDKEFIR
jgi:proline dehydrogenase